MPKTWTVQLGDGRVVDVEGDVEPTEQDVLSALKDYKPAASGMSDTGPYIPGHQPIPGYSPWGETENNQQTDLLREMIGPKENYSSNPFIASQQAALAVDKGLFRLGTSMLMAPVKAAATPVYGGAADVTAAIQNAIHEAPSSPFSTEEPMPKAEYGGNLAHLFSGGRGEDMPVNRFLADVARADPMAGIVGYTSRDAALTSPLAAVGMLPASIQRVLALGFTLDMVHAGYEQAGELGTELGKPKEQQDQAKIAQLEAGLLQSAGFAGLAGKHAITGGKSRPRSAYGDVGIDMPINSEQYRANEQARLLGGTGGRRGEHLNLSVQAGELSETIRTRNAVYLQHQLESTGVGPEQLRGLTALVGEDASAPLEAIRQSSLRGYSISDAVKAAFAVLDYQKATGRIGYRISGDEIASIIREKVGVPTRSAGEEGASSGATKTTEQERTVINASEKQKAATFYGALRSQSIGGEGEVPVAQGGGGVQPQAPGRVSPEVAQAAQGQTSLSVEEGRAAQEMWNQLTPAQRTAFAGNDVRWWALKNEQQVRFAEQAGIPATGGAIANTPKATTATPIPEKGGQTTLPMNVDERIATLAKQKVKSATEQAELVNLRRQRDAQVAMDFDLAPEDVKYLDEERKAIDAPIDIVSDKPNPDDPFSRRRAQQSADKNFMVYNPRTGRIEVLAGGFKDWIKDVPPEQRQSAIKARINEEMWHGKVSKTVGDKGATDYWNDLTAAEKAIETYQYTGQWTMPADLDARHMGHEAMRRRLQQLEGSTPGEIAEAAFREKWTLKSLDAMARAIRRSRELLGTKASKRQLELINRAQGNIDAARAAIAGGAAPGARRREPMPITIEKEDGTRYQAEFTGYFDATPIGRGFVPSVGRKTGAGMSHGLLGKGERIVENVPTPEEWNAEVTPGARRRIKVERPDGTTFEGEFSGYRDYTAHGRGHRAVLEDADGSHLQIGPRDKIVSGEVPSREEWQAEQGTPEAAEPGARRRKKGSISKPTPLTPEEWQAEYQAGMLKLPTEKTRAQVEKEKYDALMKMKELGLAEVPKTKPIEYEAPKVIPGGTELDTMVTSHLAKDVPNFKAFLSDARTKWGPQIEEGAALDTWFSGLLKYLSNAPGARLGELVDRMRLRPSVIGPERQGAARNLRETIPNPRNMPEERAEDVRQARMKKAEDLYKRARDFDDKAKVQDQQAMSAGKEEGRQLSLGERSLGAQDLRARAARNREEANKLRQEAQMLEKGASLGEKPKGKYMAQEGLLFGESLEPIGKLEAPKTYAGGTAPLEGGAEKPIRARAIAAIAQKMYKDAVGQKNLDRKNVEPDELRWSQGEKAYREVPEDILDDKFLLGQFLTEGARTDWTSRFIQAGGRAIERRKAPPESVTRRLVALLDAKTGEVHLVSAYRHGRLGPMILDPSAPGGLHRPIDTFNTKRFRPIYSALTDQPVQFFKKTFKSLDEFQRDFGQEATERAEQSTMPEGGVVGPEEFEAEGTEGIEPVREKRGVLEAPKDLTPLEARRLYQVFSLFETPTDAHEFAKRLVDRIKAAEESRKSGVGGRLADARERLKNLLDRQDYEVGEAAKNLPEKIDAARDNIAALQGKATGLSPRDLMVLSGMRKFRAMFDDPTLKKQLEQEYGTPMTEGMLDLLTLDEIYRYAKLNETPRSFINRATEELGTEPEIPVQPFESPTARDIEIKSREEQAQRATRERILSQGQSPLRPPRTIEGVRQPGEVQADERLAREMAATRQAREQGRTLAEQIVNTPLEETPSVAAYRGIAEAREAGYREAERELAAERQEEFDIGESRYDLRAEEYAAQDAAELAQREFDEAEPGARRRRRVTTAQAMRSAIAGFASVYDEWLVQRLERVGGPDTRAAAEEFNAIIDKAKENYGKLSKYVVPARAKAGAAQVLPGKGGVFGQVPSGKGFKAMLWMNGFAKQWTHYAATSRVVPSIERNLWNPKTRNMERFNVPSNATDIANAARFANLEIGNMAFGATGKARGRIRIKGLFERHLTPFGFDALQAGRGEVWDKLIDGMYIANRGKAIPQFDAQGNPLGFTAPIRRADVVRMFTKMRDELNKPQVDMAKVDRINQDMVRFFPNVITHVKHHGRWQEVVHSNLANYLENSAQRAAHISAFRDYYPNNTAGKAALANMVDRVGRELEDSSYKDDFNALIKTLQGHPTDSYVQGSVNRALGPTTMVGGALRYANQTVGNLFAKLALTGQLFVQLPETLAGATPVFLGYKSWARGMARLRDGTFYKELENGGQRNSVVYDYTWNPRSPVRTGFRLAGNVISKTFAEQALNELQEASAAAAARVTSEDILSGTLTKWQKRQLPLTMKAMGMSPVEVGLALAGDRPTLKMFERRAAAFLTGGNKAISEGSRLGANRLFNSVFRFQLYPMLKANQFRKVTLNLFDAWNGGSPALKRAATEQFATFMFGTAMQGAMVSALSAFAFGGSEGAKIWANEKKDEPVAALLDFYLAAIGGPMYLIWRGARNNGVAGISEQATRTMFPYALSREMYDMMSKDGKYRDRDVFDRIGVFVTQRTPGIRMIQTGLSLFGLSQDNKALDTSITALNRWKMDKYGLEISDRKGAQPDRSFQVAMKKAVEAIKDGDRQAYLAAIEEASGVKIDMGSATPWADIARSLRGRKVLTIDMKPMNEDQLEMLRQRIGNEAVERLQHFDGMLEVIAKSGEFYAD